MIGGLLRANAEQLQELREVPQVPSNTREQLLQRQRSGSMAVAGSGRQHRPEPPEPPAPPTLQLSQQSRVKGDVWTFTAQLTGTVVHRKSFGSDAAKVLPQPPQCLAAGALVAKAIMEQLMAPGSCMAQRLAAEGRFQFESPLAIRARGAEPDAWDLAMCQFDLQA